jgi:formate hydrogenlyase subunit 3/multisubunit Na+/H+ antiporter MnhD subunit
MSTVFAIAMIALALAPLVTASVQRAGALLSALGALLLVAVGIAAVVGDAQPVLNLGGWLGFGHSELRVDGLSGIFLTLAAVTGAATSLAYAEAQIGRWLTALGGSLLLAVAVAISSDNGFLFFLAWEALTVCIFLIASADRADPAAQIAGYFTAGLSKIGGAALLAALGLMYGHTDSFSLAVWSHASLSMGTKGVLFALLIVAFGSKIGVLPVQGGLPAGYGSAPRLGAASLSVALSAGFYGLWRFLLAILAPLPTWCGDAMLVLGALTAITGIVYAITQDDLRRFLGYSTIEQAGIVLIGLGVSVLGQSAHNRELAAAGLLAASLQVCASTLAKTLALISVDQVEQITGQRTLDTLGGLTRDAPGEAAGLGIACLTLAAIPPLSGFVSEWFTFEALLQGFRMPTLLSQLLCALSAAALALTAGLGLLAFAKYYGFIFLGPRRGEQPTRSIPRLRLSVLLPGVVLLFLGAAAPWEIRALGTGLRPLLGFDPASTVISHPLVLGPVFQKFSVLAPTWLTIVLPAYALLAYALTRTTNRRGVRREPVWVTGSAAPLSEVQYRPSSYSNPIRVVLRGPLGFRTRLINGQDSPTGSPILETTVVLAFDRFLYTPIAKFALLASRRVRPLQSGRLSIYLLYMLIALVLALSLIPILH